MKIAAELIAKPYWWEGQNLSEISDTIPKGAVDALIVGSGYTGASAALELARSGRSVLVIDSGQIGFGSSTRNFGYVGGGVGKNRLSKRHPGERGEAMGKAYETAAQFVMGLLDREQIDAGLRTEGLAILAHQPDVFQKLSEDGRSDRGRELGVDIVERERMSTVVGSSRFYGALVNPAATAVHPGKYLRGLVEAARRHGALFVSKTEALSISGSPGNWTVATNHGTISARQIGLGTNGHSGKFFQFLRRRIVPVAGTVIATEELEPALMQELFPRMNWCSDTQFGFLCFRPSPDHKRVIFAKAGLPGSFGRDIRPYVNAVSRELVATFPQLEGKAVEYAWPGSVGVTFDGAPHLGVHDGVHFAAGYNGSGVSMATFLGYWMGRRLSGDKTGDVIFEKGKFPVHILYNGNTWFMPALRMLLNHLKLQV